MLWQDGVVNIFGFDVTFAFVDWICNQIASYRCYCKFGICVRSIAEDHATTADFLILGEKKSWLSIDAYQDAKQLTLQRH